MTKNDVLEIDINLTGYCNLSCPFCDTNLKSFKEFRKNKKILDIHEWINILDSFPNLTNINLIGKSSEPTLYPKFLELCSYIKSRNLTICIRSNGDTNNFEFWEKLKHILTKDDKFYFAVEGLNNKEHSIYRIGASLDKILQNHKVFKSDNNNDYAQTVLFEHNHYLVNSDDFKNIISNFSGHEFIYSNDYPEYINGRDWYKDIPENLFAVKKRWKILSILDTKPLSKVQCRALLNKTIYIDFDGKILTCCQIPRKKLENWGLKQSGFEITGFKHFEELHMPDCNICDINIEKFAKKFNLDNRHND